MAHYAARLAGSLPHKPCADSRANRSEAVLILAIIGLTKYPAFRKIA
jgi:hypothetical protein